MAPQSVLRPVVVVVWSGGDEKLPCIAPRAEREDHVTPPGPVLYQDRQREIEARAIYHWHGGTSAARN
jgi:hypothetical protein